MLLLEGRLDSLRGDLNGTHAAQWRRLHEQCDWYRRQNPPTEHPEASITYFGPAAANLALAYRLTGQRGYLEEAWRWISTCVAYPHWGRAHMPDHDLDAGWLLHGLSLAYSWLGEDLEPERREILRAKLELQGERLHSFAEETTGRWWSSAYWQNHNWICWTGIATAGYALGRSEWTKAARANLETVLTMLPEDGSDSEGVVYWRYGVPWLAIHTDLVQRQEQADLWSTGGFLRNTTRWRLHQSAPGFEENIDHGDCHDRRSGHSVALYYRLASAYQDSTAQWLGNLVAEQHFWREAYESGVRPGVMPEAFLELLWYDPRVTPVAPDGEPGTAYFPDLGQITARTGWDSTATCVSFKAAPGGGHRAWEEGHRLKAAGGWDAMSAGHHHPDAGAFVLHSHGAFLAVDEGYSNHKRAAHHNLVLVDGEGWADEGRYHVYEGIPEERRACVRDVLAQDGFAQATAESAAMFPERLGVRRVDRTLVVTPLGRVVVLDELEADAPREWTYLLHTDWPTTQLDSDGWRLESGPGSARLTRLLPTDATATRKRTEVEANPTSSTPSLKVSKTLHTLNLTTPKTRTATFLTVLDSTGSLDPRPEPAVLLASDQGHAVSVGQGDERELILLAPLAGIIETDRVSADAAAVILSGSRVAAVRARRVDIDGAVGLRSDEPFTGVLPTETTGA
ncbi:MULTISPECIES: heparinase II/III family protein [Streptomyces]|uniref:heparinase II/III family protein n=1 Tax=Streptomyces TaxID=1883 RepID=UPI000CD53099|nr:MULTISPECIES: heparinase II/III family protein [unclassified Streptomyces]MDX3406288.1 heparinase II/III family protein [Streptomyces sp. ME02-6977A]